MTNPQNFWSTVKLYLDIPHTVNKRLAGTVPWSYCETSHEISSQNFIDLRNYLRNEGEYNGDSVLEFLKQNRIDAVKCPSVFLDNMTNTSDTARQNNKVLILRRLLPKNKNLYNTVNELVLIGML